MAARKVAAKKPTTDTKAQVRDTVPAPVMTEAQWVAIKTYNDAYLAYVRLTTEATGKVQSDDLVAAHRYARLTVRASVKSGAITCPRCEGTGKVAFEVESGRCFVCQPKPTEEVVAKAA